MEMLVNKLEKYVVPVAYKIGQQKHLNAIKNGFMKMMPLSLIGALVVLINNVFLNWGEGSFFYTIGIKLSTEAIEAISKLQAPGNAIQNGTLGIMSLMTPFVIAYAMAEERKSDAMSAGVISIASFIALTPNTTVIDYSAVEGVSSSIINSLPQSVGAFSPDWFGGANIITGLIIGLLVGELFSFLTNKNIVIKLPEDVPPNVSKAFSAVIPGGIVLIIVGLFSWFLASKGTSFPQLIGDTISEPLSKAGGLVGWVYVFFSSFLWFFGVHGALSLSALDSGVMGVFTLDNIDKFTKYGSVKAAEAAGETFHLWAKPVIDSYIFIGGTGATLGLIIAIFIASKRAEHKSIAKMALPSGIFQINEPMLFGLPIIMNPIFFIPYVIVQPVLALIVTIAYNIGFIPPITNMAPWVMPVGLGAFFSTNGSIPALLLALLNLVVATLIYLPFVIASNRMPAQSENQ